MATETKKRRMKTFFLLHCPLFSSVYCFQEKKKSLFFFFLTLTFLFFLSLSLSLSSEVKVHASVDTRTRSRELGCAVFATGRLPEKCSKRLFSGEGNREEGRKLLLPPWDFPPDLR